MAEMPKWFEFEFVVRGRYKVKADELNMLYGTTDLDEAAAIDRDNLVDDPSVLDFLMGDEVTFEVRPVE